MNSLKANLLISIVIFLIYLGLSFVFFAFKLPVYIYIVLAPFYIYLLHNLMNFVHQASHNLLSKNKALNNFLGYLFAIFSFLSFAEFKKSHILHHAHTSIPDKDPDFELTNGINVLLIPFFIWKKDVYFIKNKLWGNNKNLLFMYLFERLLQVMFLGYLLVSGSILFLAIFSLSLLLVGYLNSFFLFFFPHYSLKLENTIKKLNFKPLSFLFFLPINISRHYHDIHHKKIKTLYPYYPIEHKIISLLSHQK